MRYSMLLLFLVVWTVAEALPVLKSELPSDIPAHMKYNPREKRAAKSSEESVESKESKESSDAKTGTEETAGQAVEEAKNSCGGGDETPAEKVENPTVDKEEKPTVDAEQPVATAETATTDTTTTSRRRRNTYRMTVRDTTDEDLNATNDRELISNIAYDDEDEDDDEVNVHRLK